MRHIVAVVPDLMDRSRLPGGPDHDIRFVTLADLGSPAAVDPDLVDLVVVDLGRPGVLEALAEASIAVPVVGFGPHVDRELLAAGSAGCTRVLPRSRFFAQWPDV